MKKLLIKQIRSTIGAHPSAKKNIRALGLRKIGHEVERPDDPTIRGMVFKCSHLVEVKEVE